MISCETREQLRFKILHSIKLHNEAVVEFDVLWRCLMDLTGSRTISEVAFDFARSIPFGLKAEWIENDTLIRFTKPDNRS